MERELKLTDPRTDEEKYFQPAWLERARAEMSHDTQGMTVEEEIAYYRARRERLKAEREQKLASMDEPEASNAELPQQNVS